MIIYIYKIFTTYNNDKGIVKNFIDNHDGGNWYFIDQEDNFSIYNFPNGGLEDYSNESFKFNYDKEEEGYGTTLIQTRDSEIINYMVDFEETYLHNASFFSLQVIQPHSSENETFYAMDTYSMGNYEEGFYESAFTDHSWSTKEGEGGLDDYFEGDIKVSDLVSKAMNK
tara:strand:+ start:568 stop:1074 length:507 start_codon:yes stop_codon:yes gene_type:complete